MVELPAGESSKSLAVGSQLYDALVELQADRQTVVVAVGGGVVGAVLGVAGALAGGVGGAGFGGAVGGTTWAAAARVPRESPASVAITQRRCARRTTTSTRRS